MEGEFRFEDYIRTWSPSPPPQDSQVGLHNSSANPDEGHPTSQATDPQPPTSQAADPQVGLHGYCVDSAQGLPITQATNPQPHISQATDPQLPISQATNPQPSIIQATNPQPPISQATNPQVGPHNSSANSAQGPPITAVIAGIHQGWMARYRSHESEFRRAHNSRERAFICASRRTGRDISIRMQSARNASKCHYFNTGRWFKFNEDDVRNCRDFDITFELPAYWDEEIQPPTTWNSTWPPPKYATDWDMKPTLPPPIPLEAFQKMQVNAENVVLAVRGGNPRPTGPPPGYEFV
ncbi:hypothetical protein TRV_07964 [Trichophyton verrucosum HKI 0517]|uniref:Uncharacterized protein n=1 Tax=Trichophyton verrucosum (strain HKI 0517) TaxID=663202 RepID=D4DL90_TRIVH|nr:uncharacterized protein TRV_07964 [Trichophyton verrucosum HKI 0517]EFE37378.1 hypothetical protein TRV_07964 [Trichophyton verrucosum HKI 0517]